MKKLFIIFTGVSCLIATISRIETMGENRELLIDEANFLLYPTQIYFFPQLISLEMGSPDEIPYFFGSLKLGKGDKYSIIGICLNRKDSVFYEIPFPADTLPPGFDILYTGIWKEIGVGLRFGFARGFYNEKYEKPSYKKEIENISFGAGLLYSGDNRIFELGINLLFPLYSLETSTDTQKLTGTTCADIRMRSFLPLKGNLEFIPFLNFKILNADYKVGELNTYDKSHVRAGVGLAYTVGEIHKIVGSWEFNYRVKEFKFPGAKNKYKEYSLKSFSIGVESNPYKWLFLRFGIKKEEWTSESSFEDFEIDRTTSDFKWGAGIGIEIGNFRIDGKLGSDFLYHGPYLIGGENTGFVNLSLVYFFGGEI